jgi:hypothetical protein
LFHPKRKLSRPSETQGTADVIDVEGVVRKPLQLLDLLTSVRIQALYPALEATRATINTARVCNMSVGEEEELPPSKLGTKEHWDGVYEWVFPAWS